MIPDCEGRLQAAKADLQEFLANHLDVEEIVTSDILKKLNHFFLESLKQ